MARKDVSDAEIESDISTEQGFRLTLSKLITVEEESPNELLHFIVENSSKFLPILKDSDNDSNPELMSVALNVLGKACNADNTLRKLLNKLLLIISSDIDTITINIQRHLVKYEKLSELKKCHLQALYNLTELLKKIQLTLPSSSLYTISILLPILTCTCDKYLKIDKELYSACLENLNLLENEQKCFYEHHSLHDEKKMSEIEQLHFQEPPENFRTLSVLPTADDVSLPCSFLRPNITKGRYKDAEHYLDVQFRLLREDYIKPLRDGVAEYLILKKNNKDVKKCKNIRVYENACVHSEEFVDGDLLHVIQFQEKYFSTVNWECSKRFIRGNLLCFTTDCFHTMMFATVVLRKTEDIKRGLLHVKFENTNDKLLNLDLSLRYVVIEVPTLFESYCHSLNVLQQLTEETLPLKSYIIDVEKIVKEPQYLLTTSAYDFGPLLIPLQKSRNIFSSRVIKNYPNVDFDKYKSVFVMNDSEWPSASELLLDESQYNALKSAITKEFSIIQGPPGTGKTYIGLRAVQLLLHNIDRWFNDEPNTLPILVVCYTNHALDQFLEGISKLTRKIVRIGGRGQNEMIERFQIKNLVRTAIRSGEMPHENTNSVACIKQDIEDLKEDIEGFDDFEKDSIDHVFHENILKKHIPSIQFHSLMKFRNKNQSETGQIRTWLEVETNETFQDDIDYQIFPVRTIGGRMDIDSVEDEGDIEFIENQRNIDCYDFEDRLILKRSQHQGESKQRKSEYIKNSLKNNPTMSERRALKIKNIWFLPINERWQLYKFWLGKFLAVKRQEYLELQEKLKDSLERLSRLRTEQDLFVIQDALVVGMTTTGAAKYRHLIDNRNPVILIVEEAAEILESHIITSLAPTTQHVILIGDQQQLRPSPTVYMLAVKYGMNVSLFERMIDNGMEFCQLSLQHRMRPEISALIVPHIYPNLRNHQSVSSFENIMGVNKNVFFINHQFKELNVEDSKSKVNDHEAKFIVRLCRYLIYQGYAPSQITVLTTYTGQLFVLKKIVKDELVKQVRFTVVDNFQGEENDIILISFVRSNDKGEVGFLKVSNRICVALSRAKKGLFCIGNFELLAQKSNLWQNIVQTLTENKSIGPSLRLCCQNHPDLFTDVVKDSDFDTVPDGGCNQKCEFRLSCGHSCTLYCHPYDPEHESFRCKKPCIETCDQGHLCPKQCWEKCGRCQVLVYKTLSRCGHSVNTFCGLDEDEIDCEEACRTVCKEGHLCPKKCFEPCRLCTVIVDRVLPKCGHTMKAPCYKPIGNILCENQCSKSCVRGHPCQKLCCELCGSCQVPVDKKLSCGHVIKAACSKPETLIKCTLRCEKLLPCSHQCMKKCYEACEKVCEQITEIQSSKCGHKLKIECNLRNDLEALSKRCSEPCKDVLTCGHLCKGTCSKCKQKTAHVVCEEVCEKMLHCGHKCSNKCSDLCIKKCLKLVKIESPICGHKVETECEFVQNLSELSKKCVQSCKTVLPCGHACKGTCSKCYQGRLHIFCNEPCERILICGHKCQAKCFKSCPPCRRPCENRCMHRRCPRKCGDPCVKCTKHCNWSCQHKKCSRRCYEVCDRDPCTVQCQKRLTCGHQCIGFCGEPCPNVCLICDKNCREDDSSDVRVAKKVDNFSGYVFLEDCQHSLKEDELKEWIINNPSEMQEIKMKACPKCGSLVHKNARYDKIIKNVLSDVERIKLIAKWDEMKNLEIQRSLLERVKSSHSNINIMYKPIVKILSGGNVRSIQELTAIENVMNLANEIELKKYGIHSMFVLKPFHETLVCYARSCREMMKDFILLNFLTLSEYQLYQLSRELYRLTLLDHLMMLAKQNNFTSVSPDFERLASSLTTFTPFTDEEADRFGREVENFPTSFKSLPYNDFSTIKVVNMSGDWYRCLKSHVTCIKKFEDNVPLRCHECDETERNSNGHRSRVVEDVEYGLDEPDVEETSQSLVAEKSSKVNTMALQMMKLIEKSATKTSSSDTRTNHMKYIDPFLPNSDTRRQYGRMMQTDRTRKNMTQRTISAGKNLSSDVKANFQGKSVPRFPKSSNSFTDSIAGKNAALRMKSTDYKLPLHTEAKSQDKHRSYSSPRRPREVLKDSRAGRNAALKVKSTEDNLLPDTESKSQDKQISRSFLNPNSLRMSGEILKNSRAGRNVGAKVKSTHDNLPLDTEAKSQDKLSSQSFLNPNSRSMSGEVLKTSRAGRNVAVKVNDKLTLLAKRPKRCSTLFPVLPKF